ncbi:hypothetical protein B0H14DRAFT_528222 [Mycena olivaceomarginata]|nr:hypothetical protein B0H14DRAFT_528222 [Mycena olivaceomarginata]
MSLVACSAYSSEDQAGGSSHRAPGRWIFLWYAGGERARALRRPEYPSGPAEPFSRMHGLRYSTKCASAALSSSRSSAHLRLRATKTRTIGPIKTQPHMQLSVVATRTRTRPFVACAALRIWTSLPLHPPSTTPASSSLPASPTRLTAGKRPKGHPDAPTPNPEPPEAPFIQTTGRREYNCSCPAYICPSRTSPSPRKRTIDVFGSGTRRPERDGYRTDSENESDSGNCRTYRRC